MRIKETYRRLIAGTLLSVLGSFMLLLLFHGHEVSCCSHDSDSAQFVTQDVFDPDCSVCDTILSPFLSALSLEEYVLPPVEGLFLFASVEEPISSFVSSFYLRAPPIFS